MDGWHIALYGFAVFLAVRTLVVLMRAYERELRKKAYEEAVRARKNAAKSAESPPAG